MAKKSQSAKGNISAENSGELHVETKSNIEEKFDLLLQMFGELKKEVDELRSSSNESPETETQIVEPVYEYDEGDIEIRPDAYIRVISLCPYQLNLSTLGMGKGKLFRFSGFGVTKRIVYTDLVDILEAHQKFLEEGYFYILDKRIIRKHGLEDIYSKILPKDKIDKIISGNAASDIVSLFKSANKTQQGLIVEMIVDKATRGESVDLNLIDKLTRASGININQKIEDRKISGNLEK